jgi:hypothetical protein
MKSVMRQIVDNEGIVAVGHRTDESLGVSMTFRTDPVAAEHTQWEKRLNTACQMLDVAEKNLGHEVCLRGTNIAALKVVLGDQVWNVQRQGGDYITIVSIKGHPVTKSLQRMVRRGLKKIKASYGTPSAPDTRRFVPRIVEDPPASSPLVPQTQVDSSKAAVTITDTDTFTKPKPPPTVFDRLGDDDDSV